MPYNPDRERAAPPVLSRERIRLAARAAAILLVLGLLWALVRGIDFMPLAVWLNGSKNTSAARVEKLVHQAETLREVGVLKKARDKLAEAVSIAPGDAKVKRLLAEVNDQIRRKTNEANRARARQYQEWRAKARRLKRNRQLLEAAQAFDRAATFAPTGNTEAREAAAQSRHDHYVKQAQAVEGDDPKRAAELYAEALTHRDNVSIRRARDHTLMEQGRREQEAQRQKELTSVSTADLAKMQADRLAAFEAFLIADKYAEAREMAKSAAAEEAMKPFAPSWQAAVRVVNALEARRQIIRKKVARMKGREQSFDTKQGRRQGEIKNVTAEGMTLKNQFIVDGQKVPGIKYRIEWADLTLKQSDALAADWKPSGQEGHVARGFLALAAADRAALIEAVDLSAGHPLAKYLRRRLVSLQSEGRYRKAMAQAKAAIRAGMWTKASDAAKRALREKPDDRDAREFMRQIALGKSRRPPLGQYKCVKCKDTYEIRCLRCNGSGRRKSQVRVRCKTCSGSGKDLSYRMDNWTRQQLDAIAASKDKYINMTICQDCKGRKWTRPACSLCSGTKKMTCPACTKPPSTNSRSSTRRTRSRR